MKPKSEMDLAQSWSLLCGQLDIAAATSQQLWFDLVKRYQTPPRVYHNLDHIMYCLTVAKPYLPQVNDPLLVELAIWYHDIVYDTQAQDNEQRSAAAMREVLQAAGLSPLLLDEVSRLILLTQTHAASPEDLNAALLLDADLAILGAAATEYQWYAQAIRQEYNWVPEKIYQRERGRVLQHFLQRETIYLTAPLHQQREQNARLNLSQELDTLREMDFGERNL